MATRKTAAAKTSAPAVKDDAAEKEHAAFLAAGEDPAIVAAAQITNGMPAVEVKRRILAVIAE